MNILPYLFRGDIVIYLPIIIRSLLGGFTNVFASLAMNHMPTAHFLIIRNIILMFISLLNTKELKKDLDTIKNDKELLKSTALGLTLVSLSSIAFYYSIELLPLYLVSSLENTLHILMSLVLGIFFFKSKPNWKVIVLSLALIPTSSLIILNGTTLATDVSILGLGLLIFSALAYVADSYLTKSQLSKISVGTTVILRATAAVMFTSGLLFFTDKPLTHSVTNTALIAFLFIIAGALNNFIINTLYTVSIKRIGSHLTTSFSVLTTVVAVTLAVLIEDSELLVTQWVGLILTVTILVIIARVKVTNNV